MKRCFSILSGAAIMVLPLLFSCSRNQSEGAPTLVNGQITPAPETTITLSAGSFLDSCRLDNEGRFSFRLALDQPVYGVIFFDNRLKELYLEPGKDLNLQIPLDRFPDDIRFDGSLGAVNQYLHLAAKLEQKTAESAEILYALEPADFIQRSDSVRDLKLTLLKEYLMRYSGIDSAFVRSHQTDIWYGWALGRLQYPGRYLALTNQLASLPNGYHPDYLSQLNLNNGENLSSMAYRTFLESYLDYREAIYLNEHPEVNKLWFPSSVARFRVIYSDLTDTLVKDWALFQAMSDHLDSYGTTHVESFITDFRFQCKNEEYKQSVETRLAQWEKLARGNKMIDFPLIGINGEKKKVSDYYGQLLYINFWASWSTWSLQDMAWWETLRKEFEPKGITFLAVSMDFAKDRKKWEYIVSSKNLGGQQAMQDPNSTVLGEVYSLNQLPRYFLVDSEGNIISVHAPGPAEEGIRETLERLREGG